MMDKHQLKLELQQKIQQHKHRIEMIKSILKYHSETDQKSPNIGMQISSYSLKAGWDGNVFLLEKRYLPFETESMIAVYLENMATHVTDLQNELESLQKSKNI